MSQSRQSSILLALLCVVLLGSAGCASQPTVIPSSGPRPPTDPGSLAILEKEPSKYQVLGVVVATDNLIWGKGAQIDPVMDTLKTKAAELGANALLLQAEGAGLKATGMYRSKSYQVPIDKIPATKAMATAIWVID